MHELQHQRDILRIFRGNYSNMAIEHAGVDSINKAMTNTATLVIDAIPDTHPCIITSSQIVETLPQWTTKKMTREFTHIVQKTIADLERGIPNGGLTVSINKLQINMRSHNNTQLSKSAALVLASILEYVATHILEASAAIAHGSRRINATHVRNALSKNTPWKKNISLRGVEALTSMFFLTPQKRAASAA